MASSGKKGKKIKGKTFGLTEFLADSATGPGAVQTVIPRKSGNWADDVENEDDFYDFSRKEKVILPTAPRATRSPDIDDEKVPKDPPYLAYISNLSYDVDTDDISEFFQDLEITGIRLPRDTSQKPKGFGYVEFANRKSLISALSMGDMTMKNRRVRIEVADSSDNDRRRGGMRDRGEVGRDRTDGPDRTMGDWRSGPRSDPVPDSDRDTGGYGRDRDGGYDRRGGGRREFGSGGFRDGDRGFRDSYDRDRGYDSRDGFGGRYGSDRDGYGDRDRFGSRRGGDRDRDRDRDFGGGRSGFGPSRRPYGSGPDYDNRGREDAPPERAEPRERPRLNLQPRTLPEEPAAPAPVAQSSIFGGAKPVDTSAREKEIEERLAKEKEDISRPPPRDNRSDDSRRDDQVRQISSQSLERSKSGSEYGDRDDDGPNDKLPTPQRVEPAPPPKENVWTRRSQQALNTESAEGNGRLSPHSDYDQDQRNTGRYQPPRPDSPRRFHGESGDTERRQLPSRSTGRRQFEGDSRGTRDDRGSRDDRMSRDDRGGRDDRMGRDDRGGRDDRINRDDRGGRDDRMSRDDKSGRRGGTLSSRGGDKQRRPPSDRDHKKEIGPQDELGRMPKYREQEVPNFAGSNKFAYLDEDELAETD